MSHGQHESNGRITRLRLWLLALTVVIVFAAFAAPITVVVLLGRQSARVQLDITCALTRTNIAQLGAVREIADQLGVPTHFTIPEVPAECDGH